MAQATTDTVDPLRFRDVSRQLRISGFSYEKDRCGYVYKDVHGIEWIVRLRETEYGVNIDTHYVDNRGKERVV